MLDRARTRRLAALGGLDLIEAAHAHPHFPPHTHDTYALGLVDRGVNRFRYRGAWHEAPAGALCTVTPGEVHTVEPAGAAGFAYRCLYPPIALLEEAAEAAGGRPRGGRLLLLRPVIEDAGTARLLSRLLARVNGGAPSLDTEALLGSLILRVAVRHAVQAVREDSTSLPGRLLERARELLLDRLQENVTLREAAAAAEMGRFAFLRAFSRAYGLTPHAWVIQERVRRAQALLRAGRTLADVAAEVGFTDQSHLSRHFRRLVGITPGCYRTGGR